MPSLYLACETVYGFGTQQYILSCNADPVPYPWSEFFLPGSWIQCQIHIKFIHFLPKWAGCLFLIPGPRILTKKGKFKFFLLLTFVDLETAGLRQCWFMLRWVKKRVGVFNLLPTSIGHLCDLARVERCAMTWSARSVPPYNKRKCWEYFLHISYCKIAEIKYVFNLKFFVAVLKDIEQIISQAKSKKQELKTFIASFKKKAVLPMV